MLKILLADANALVRERLKQILADTIDMVVGGEAASEHQVLEMIRSDKWDLVLLDMTMPGSKSLDTLSRLKKEQPDLPVLMLSMHHEEEYAVRSFRTGVSGYLTKENIPQELIGAIRKIARGGRYISASLANPCRMVH